MQGKSRFPMDKSPASSHFLMDKAGLLSHFPMDSYAFWAICRLLETIYPGVITNHTVPYNILNRLYARFTLSLPTRDFIPNLTFKNEKHYGHE